MKLTYPIHCRQLKAVIVKIANNNAKQLCNMRIDKIGCMLEQSAKRYSVSSAGKPTLTIR